MSDDTKLPFLNDDSPEAVFGEKSESNPKFRIAQLEEENARLRKKIRSLTEGNESLQDTQVELNSQLDDWELDKQKIREQAATINRLEETVAELRKAR